MITVKDQMGRRVKLPETPQRIISLVPSQTELLFDLGLNEAVIGITKFCIHPEHWKREKAIVGGTKQVNLELIESLKPDLIIGNKEENEKEFIDELTTKYPVWMSDIHDLNEALDMVESVGEIVGRTIEAESIVVDILEGFEELKTRTTEQKGAVYLIWKNPYMAAGSNTFINEMLGYAGFKNLITEERYPELTMDRIKELQPQPTCVLLSSEPYPFKEKHIEEIQEALPETEVKLVDGEMFSWYGSRLLKVPAYFKAL